jgi:signal peptidase I
MMARGLCAGMLLVTLVVACGEGGSVVGEFRMQGLTMTPTLPDGTALDAIDYGGNRPERGDIIIFRSSTYPDRSFVKRVIGIPGDTVEVSETTGEVRLNGDLLDEPYASGATECIETCEWTLPPAFSDEAQGRCGSNACYFVMGDNRADPGDSADSRRGWLVTSESIVGRVEVKH